LLRSSEDEADLKGSRPGLKAARAKSNVTDATGVLKRNRSAATNGKKLIPGLSGRSPWIRRCKDIIDTHVSDLGGRDNISSAEYSIVRRAAVMTTQLERMEHRFAVAEGNVTPEDLETYGRATNTMRRLLEAVGLERRAKDVTPTFGQLLRQDAIEQQLEDAAANAESRRAFEAKQREASS
jgi:hypothetical protein